MEIKKLELEKIFINNAINHNPEYNEEKMIKSMKLSANNLINEVIKLRNKVIEKKVIKFLMNIKKKEMKVRDIVWLKGFC